MTSPHQASSSVSRNGCPPMAAVFGTGTSIVRTGGFSTVFGYRRCTLTCRESGSSTGANLMCWPAMVMSVSPARRTVVRSRATSAAPPGGDHLPAVTALSSSSDSRMICGRPAGPGLVDPLHESDLEDGDARLGGQAGGRVADAALPQRPGDRRGEGGELDQLAFAQLRVRVDDGLARSEASAAALTAAGAKVQPGTLDDPGVLRSAAAACDGVIHLAFKHDIAFTGDFQGAADADRRAVETFGHVLAGTGLPLVIASGTAGIAPGQVATERDGHGPAPTHLGGGPETRRGTAELGSSRTWKRATTSTRATKWPRRVTHAPAAPATVGRAGHRQREQRSGPAGRAQCRSAPQDSRADGRNLTSGPHPPAARP